MFDHRDEVLNSTFKRPSILEILIISRGLNDKNNAVHMISFYSPELPVKQLYVVWQVRNINSSRQDNFCLDENMQPCKILWCNHHESNEFPNLPDDLKKQITMHSSILTDMVQIAMMKIDCKNFKSYIAIFKATSKLIL